MTIEQLRRLKHLSEMPTHSAESLEELKELVRMATIRVLLWKDVLDSGTYHELCDCCSNSKDCKQRYCADMNHCEIQQNFQLEMEGD